VKASKTRKPTKKELPAPIVREFRDKLDVALSASDAVGRQWADARWGCYAFYDYDGEPIYVGQTNEQLRARIRRHLTNQRTDAVAMRILDIFEVAEMELWPLWEFEGVIKKDDPTGYRKAKERLNAVEYTAYLMSIEQSKFKAILNEKIPPRTAETIELPCSMRFKLISENTRADRGHPDVRIARRAETIARLAAVAHERGEVSEGLRRVLVIQGVRLAYLAAVRLAETEGRDTPDPSVIHTRKLVGTVEYELSDPEGETDTDPMMSEGEDSDE
jgi:hypothetical protein